MKYVSLALFSLECCKHATLVNGTKTLLEFSAFPNLAWLVVVSVLVVKS